ncbi:uncharacterized protein EV420DRAFT_1765319, partial [Desarmillaria tabescens]
MSSRRFSHIDPLPSSISGPVQFSSDLLPRNTSSRDPVSNRAGIKNIDVVTGVLFITDRYSHALHIHGHNTHIDPDFRNVAGAAPATEIVKRTSTSESASVGYATLNGGTTGGAGGTTTTVTTLAALTSAVPGDSAKIVIIS